MAIVSKILSVSDRGQITLPKKMLTTMKVKFFTCHLENGEIMLKPLKTREEFFAELEESEKDWEKNGGIPWQKVMKKAKLI